MCHTFRYGGEEIVGEFFANRENFPRLQGVCYELARLLIAGLFLLAASKWFHSRQRITSSHNCYSPLQL